VSYVFMPSLKELDNLTCTMTSDALILWYTCTIGLCDNRDMPIIVV